LLALAREQVRRRSSSIAREQVEVMAALGFDRFAVVGHDRGARCAYRMAIDHPDVDDDRPAVIRTR
jgi:pimeloyl-ACP methyl ester carboxylesterase